MAKMEMYVLEHSNIFSNRNILKYAQQCVNHKSKQIFNYKVKTNDSIASYHPEF